MKQINDGSQYSLLDYLRPIWNSKKVINESILFIQNHGCALLYEDFNIKHIRSSDLKKEYSVKDFYIKDNYLYQTACSEIPYMQLSELYPNEPGENIRERNGGGYIYSSEGDFFPSKQVVVTYSHKGNWAGPVPEDKAYIFSGNLKKITNDENFNLMFFGDSITAGSNASGKLGFEPYADCWAKQVVDFLSLWAERSINYNNYAVPGKDSMWGIQSIKETLSEKIPDIAIVAFGMNDLQLSVEEHIENVKIMVDLILEANNKANILLVSPMLPNSEMKKFYKQQPNFEEQLLNLEKKYSTVGVATVTSMHKYILTRKKYLDITGNNVNHPNDFLSRIYSQTILKTLLGAEFENFFNEASFFDNE